MLLREVEEHSCTRTIQTGGQRPRQSSSYRPTITYNRAAMKQRKQLQTLLTEKNLKKTSQRALIWGALLETEGHPSVEEIRDSLLNQGHRIGVATIYRTLKILLESGYIRQSKLHGMTHYEPVVGQPNHLHFICNVCGSTVEFPSRKVES